MCIYMKISLCLPFQLWAHSGGTQWQVNIAWMGNVRRRAASKTLRNVFTLCTTSVHTSHQTGELHCNKHWQYFPSASEQQSATRRMKLKQSKGSVSQTHEQQSLRLGAVREESADSSFKVFIKKSVTWANPPWPLCSGHLLYAKHAVTSREHCSPSLP